MSLLYFVLLTSVLVLVHELGHFFVAKAFGVRVLTFSLGFGPTLFSIKGRETTFRVGLLPFGGFVKLHEDPSTAFERQNSARSEDLGRTFQAQSVGRRILITLAGPLMNLLLPFVVFFFLFFGTGRIAAPLVGTVLPNSPADSVLLAGDRVVAIDGKYVRSYAELQNKIESSPGKKLRLRVVRRMDAVTYAVPSAGPSVAVSATVKAHDEETEVTITPASVQERDELGTERTIGRAGISPARTMAAIGISNIQSPAYRAGLRTFDVITNVGGVPTPRLHDVEKRFRENRGHAVPVTYLRPQPFAVTDGSPYIVMAVLEPHIVMLAPEPVQLRDGEGLRRTGIESAELYVSFVPEGSSEWRAGLRPGDKVLTLDSQPITSWQSLVDELLRGGDRTREMTWSRDGRVMSGMMRVRKEEWFDSNTRSWMERYVFRSSHFAPQMPEALQPHPEPIRYALAQTLSEMASIIRFLGKSAVGIVQGKIGVSTLSGPLQIYDITGRAASRGIADFFWVLAFISINLGLLNLLPIPTLDGGQLLFIGIEIVLRRAVPLRLREILSVVGLMILLTVMAIALRNDILRAKENANTPPPVSVSVREFFVSRFT